MTKTLADMTPEERAKCDGMWATYLGVETGVILWSNNRSAYVLFPDGMREQTCKNRDVVPRFDLPRAWNPDGSPLQAARETITGFDGMRLDAPGGDSFLTTSGTTYHRWVTGWKEVE